MSFIKMLMCLAEVGWWGCFVDTSVGLARDTSNANAGSSFSQTLDVLFEKKIIQFQVYYIRELRLVVILELVITLGVKILGIWCYLLRQGRKVPINLDD